MVNKINSYIKFTCSGNTVMDSVPYKEFTYHIKPPMWSEDISKTEIICNKNIKTYQKKKEYLQDLVKNPILKCENGYLNSLNIIDGLAMYNCLESKNKQSCTINNINIKNNNFKCKQGYGISFIDFKNGKIHCCKQQLFTKGVIIIIVVFFLIFMYFYYKYKY